MIVISPLYPRIIGFFNVRFKLIVRLSFDPHRKSAGLKTGAIAFGLRKKYPRLGLTAGEPAVMEGISFLLGYSKKLQNVLGGYI